MSAFPAVQTYENRRAAIKQAHGGTDKLISSAGIKIALNHVLRALTRSHRFERDKDRHYFYYSFNFFCFLLKKIVSLHHQIK
jgi:hypothetical protein